MVQKRVQQKTEVVKPKLTISNESFKTKLNERIKIGEELINRKLNTQEDFVKVISDYKLWTDYNFEFLQQVFDIPDNEYMDSYNHAGYTFMGQKGVVQGNDVLTQQNLVKYKLEDLNSLFVKADLIKSEIIASPSSIENKSPKSKDEVFIVHGHDDIAKLETARFIELLGFKPIILHEKPNSGKTIIEKIEKYSDVGFGIVLYTPCDVGAVKSDSNNLNQRARQNVVFEHGYLIGRIGRENVSALVKGKIETPNDISGVVYISMENDWKLELAKELRNSGYKVDMNKVI